MKDNYDNFSLNNILFNNNPIIIFLFPFTIGVIEAITHESIFPGKKG